MEKKKLVTSISPIYAPTSKDRGAFSFTFVSLSVCLSIRLSVCSNLLKTLNIFLLLQNQFSYKAHIWYEGTSH